MKTLVVGDVHQKIDQVEKIISGWTDGKLRAFLPQSGKLFWIINDCHKPGE